LGVVPVELGVKVPEAVALDIGFISDLEVKLCIDSAKILNGQFRVALEGHWPIAVKAAVRIGGDHARTDLGESTPTVGKKVTEGNFDCRLGLMVPVRPQH
jgi:hypothetical protein